jgi:uncharacterized protein YifE (UPF0438 family)
MPAVSLLPAIAPDHASRIGHWCDALARACAATESWRLHGWSRGAATAVGALSARRIERSLVLDGAPAEGRVEAGSVGELPVHRAWLRSRPVSYGRAGTSTVAADAATACRSLHRGLLDDPSRAAPRLAGLVLASLRVRDVQAAGPDVELVLLGPRAPLEPFAETVVRGEALNDALRALAALAGVVSAQLSADMRTPWADLDRIGRVCAAAGHGEAFVELAWHLLDDLLGPPWPQAEPSVPDSERHRLLRADAELPDDARLELPVALAAILPEPARRDVAPRLEAAPQSDGAPPGEAAPPDASPVPDGLRTHDEPPSSLAPGDDGHEERDAFHDHCDPLRDLHLAALSIPFQVDPAAAAGAELDATEVERLARFGTWYERLADGRLMPDSAAQHHFVLAAKGRADPVGEHERLWRKYRTAVRRLAMSAVTATATATTTATATPAATAPPPSPPSPAFPPSPADQPADAAGPPTLPMPTSAPPSASARATGPSLSSRMLFETFERATAEELLELTRALDGQESASVPLAASLLMERIGLAGRSGLTTSATLGCATYLEMLRDAAEALGVDRIWWTARTGPTGIDLASIDSTRGTSLRDPIQRDPTQRDAAAALQAWVDELETEVLRSIVGTLQRRLEPAQRTRLAQAVLLRAGRHGVDLSDSVTPGGELSVLHLGGFAIYTTLSTALGFVAAALPALSGYTLASSLLGAILGPAGRPVLGDEPAGRTIGPNARRVLRLVATVAMIRQGAVASTPPGDPRRVRASTPA